MTKINDFLTERETEGLANFHFTPTAKKPSSDDGAPPPPVPPHDGDDGDDGEGEYNPEPDAHPHAIHTADPHDMLMLHKATITGKYGEHTGFPTKEEALHKHADEWESGVPKDRAVITSDTKPYAIEGHLYPEDGTHTHGARTKVEHMESYNDTVPGRMVHHFHVTKFDPSKYEVKESVGKTIKELLSEAPWDTGYELTPHEKMEENNSVPFDDRLNQFAHHVHANRNISNGIDTPGYHPLDPETGESLLGHDFSNFKKKNAILKGQLDRPEFATRGHSIAQTSSMNSFKHVPVGTVLSHDEFMDLLGNRGLRLHKEQSKDKPHWAHTEILNSLDPKVTYHGNRPNYTGMHGVAVHIPQGTVGARMTYGMDHDDRINSAVNDTRFKFHPGVKFEKVQDYHEEGREIKDRVPGYPNADNTGWVGGRRRRAKVPVTTQHFMVHGLEQAEPVQEDVKWVDFKAKKALDGPPKKTMTLMPWLATVAKHYNATVKPHLHDKNSQEYHDAYKAHVEFKNALGSPTRE